MTKTLAGTLRGLATALGVVLTAAGGGLLFAPVFGAGPLLAPLLGVAAAVLFADAVTIRVGALGLLRPPLAAWLGAFTAAITAGAGAADVLRAGRDGWARTLQTTWPVVDRPDLMLFVPLLVLLAALLGVELLRRTGSPLVALVPAVAPAVVAQAFAPVTGVAAVLAALALGGGAVWTLTFGGHARVGAARLVVTAAVIGLVAGPLGLAAVTWSAADRPPAVLAAAAQPAPRRAASPLDEIAGMLGRPDQVAFKVRGDSRAARWILVAYDGFDGDNWTSDERYRPVGGPLPEPPGAPAGRSHSAAVQPVDLPGPWLPSQPRPTRVSGTGVLVAAAGTLLAADPAPGGYTLSWSAPDLEAPGLADAAVDPLLGGGMSLGDPPPALETFARAAVQNAPPSLRTARSLEQFLRQRYRLATDAPLPTGHGYAQLQYFLGTAKRGTSEQFAAAYVVLARLLGIPARLVVGFRQPAAGPDGTAVVHYRDVLAWPEVAVAGYGWVPLDPTSATGAGRSAGDDQVPDADAAPKPVTTQAAIAAPSAAPSASAPGPSPVPTGDGGIGRWTLLAAGALALALWLGGVPLGKRVRAGRRRGGGPAIAVFGAWREARDRLRDHGVHDGGAMTVRDLAGVAGDDVAPGLHELAACVDHARWSGRAVPPETASRAWAATDAVRRGLAGRGRWRRVRAAVSPGTLLRRG